MTTDLIKTLEGLDVKATKMPWEYIEQRDGDGWLDLLPNQFFQNKHDAELIAKLRNSLPQIISALKDAERMREAIEKVLDCDKEGSIDLGMNLFHYLTNSLTPTADTKESEV